MSASEMFAFLVEQGIDIDMADNSGEMPVDRFNVIVRPVKFYNELVERFEAIYPDFYERITHRKNELADFRYYHKEQNRTKNGK